MFGVIIRKSAVFCEIDIDYINSFCSDKPLKLMKLQEAWYLGEVNGTCPKWALPEKDGYEDCEMKAQILSWMDDRNEEPKKAALQVKKSSWKESGHLYTKAHQMNQLCLLFKTRGKFRNWKFV
jgi:hypothetical protein